MAKTSKTSASLFLKNTTQIVLRCTSNYMITFCVILCLLSGPSSVLAGSHSIWMLATFIKGETPFPQFSVTVLLDDITVGHYNSETLRYVPIGNTTNEDDMLDSFEDLSDRLHAHFMRRSSHLKPANQTESPVVYQVLGVCELLDNDKPGQMVSRNAFRGTTTDELRYFDSKFTYQGTLNYSAAVINTYLELSKWRHETVYYPAYIQTLQNYLKKRGTQVKRKVKPRVRLIQKANTYSGGFLVSCLATGFYPRHINLTLFRDGQPVSDHEITGGDLLPNDDGTYQMRKSLEISAEEEREKHKYTCSAKHLSLDNKLDVSLEYNPGKPFESVISLVLISLVFVLLCGAAVIKWKRYAASPKKTYSSASQSIEDKDTEP